MITFNGHTSDEYGIRFTAATPLTKPSRKVEKYSVPGRNGDILMPQKAFSNVALEYGAVGSKKSSGDVYVQYGTAESSLTEVVNWLSSSSGYKRLEDDADPDHFRLAQFTGYGDVQNIKNKFWTAVFEFDSKPQRYLKSGEEAVTIIVAPAAISNPTQFPARPLLLVTGGGAAGTVTVNGTVFTISDTSVPVYIDCETMDCYDGSGNNKNSIVSSSTSEFATLSPGNNSIGFSGAVSTVQITPRWWEL